MHQCGRLKSLAGLLLGHLLGGQLPQFVIDQGQKLLGGRGVALLNGGHDASDVGHGRGFQEREPAYDYSGSAPPPPRTVTGGNPLAGKMADHLDRAHGCGIAVA